MAQMQTPQLTDFRLDENHDAPPGLLAHSLVQYVGQVRDRKSIHDAKEAIVHALGAAATSNWLKDALRAAVQRSPADAAHDAEHLARLLGDYCDALVRNDRAT